ncbi:MAG: radical SAM family heme chaperone HemW [Deltaproteobacteria bacterium]|nr:radical SAM family heme chaperone HemW [Deltaproteobacteria bacterium]
MTSLTEALIGVYVHIPFCVSRCPYCDFNSSASGSPPEDEYVSALVAELSALVQQEGLSRPLASIYIGGGTPSLFSAKGIGAIIHAIKEAMTPVPSIEITIEVNPDSASLDKLKGYRDAGVNRLSIGIQSFDDKILKTLGRPHTAAQAAAAMDAGYKAGFTNIGADLIFGANGQRLEDWLGDVQTLIRLKPEHVSIYGLTVEEGTPYARLYKEARLLKTPQDEEAEMYSSAIALLKEAGWIHYEISNLARPGFQSVHNRAYWRGRDYIGLGAGAHSYLSYPAHPGWGRRWWNVAAPDEYMKAASSGNGAIADSETLDREKALTEAVMLGLRDLETGITAATFQRRFGLPLKEALPAWAGLANDGFIEEYANGLRLSFRGALIANDLFLRLLKQ